MKKTHKLQKQNLSLMQILRRRNAVDGIRFVLPENKDTEFLKDYKNGTERNQHNDTPIEMGDSNEFTESVDQPED